jgi:antitoxin (DNA-binding transcriptional repressor) of toxin-antitoxin stability system
MKRIYHLSTCDNCRKLIKAFNPSADFELVDIKTNSIDAQTLDFLKEKVGSYEAKTKLPELLRGVQAGNHYTITLRGEAVAELVPAQFDISPDKGAAVDDMLAFMKKRKSLASINLKALINEGRE